MSNTYTQLHIQLVFAVKYRAALISPEWSDRLYRYITGIVQQKNHKMLQINGMADHIHIFLGLRPNEAISDLVCDIKSTASLWINENKFCRSRFYWQEGFGAFSYSRADVQNVIRYIKNQEIHHAKKTFIDEYKELLQTFDVAYEDAHLFLPPK